MNIIKVGGYEFSVYGDPASVPLKEYAGMYLAIKAIEGDRLAQAILEAAGKKINDAHGNIIYPPRDRTVTNP